jgi:hypothetical protein
MLQTSLRGGVARVVATAVMAREAVRHPQLRKLIEMTDHAQG